MNSGFSKIWIIVILLVLLSGGYLGYRYLKPQEKITTSLLFTLPAGKFDDIIFSPDGQRYAFSSTTEQNEKFYIVDGKDKKKYDDVIGFIFSPNNKRFAYSVRDKKGKEYFYVIDGKEELLKFNGRSDLVFSTNGKNYAYIGYEADNSNIVTGGKLVVNGKVVQNIPLEKIGRFGLFVSDEREYTYYTLVSSFEYEPYKFYKNGELVAFYPFSEFESIDELSMTYNENGESFAFTASQIEASKSYDMLVVNGEEYVKFTQDEDFLPSIDSYSLVFNANGDKIAYIVRFAEDKEAIFVNKEKIIEGNNLEIEDFTPDNQTLVYTSEDKDGYYLTVGNQKFGPYETFPSSLQLSVDGKAGYEIGKRGEESLVINGERKSPYYPRIININFSSDGKHFVFKVIPDDSKIHKQLLVIDGEELEKYDDIQGPFFTSDSKHLFYYGLKDSEVWKIKVTLDSKFDIAQFSPTQKIEDPFKQEKEELKAIEGEK